ncbi:MAG: hypothetical protein U1E36_07175 [Rickettsiales bacterium]
MRRFVWVIIALLVVAVAAYSAFWFSQAKQAKEVFTQAAKELPNITKNTGTEVSLKYDSIDVGGYPFSYIITYHNPVFSWKPKFAPDIQPFKTTDGTQPENTLKVTGDLNFESNYLASSFGVSATGSMDGTQKTPEGPFSWQANWEDTSGCTFEITGEARKKLLQGMQVLTLLKDSQSVMENLRGIDCTSKANSIKRMPDGKQIFASPGSNVHFGIEPLEGLNSRIDIKADAKDVLMTKEYGQLIGSFMHRNPGEPAPSFKQFDERAGKTSMDIDVSATGPFRNNGTMPTDYNLDIQARSLNIKNDWYEVNFPLAFTMKKAGAVTSFSVKHDGLIHFSKEMEDALRQDYLTSGSAYGELKRLFENQGRVPPSEDAMISSGVFPEISSFGTIKTIADIATDAEGKSLSINQFAVTSDLYGIDAKGQASLTEPKADVTVNCTHCTQMVDDLISYYNRTQDFLRQINPGNQYPIFTATQAEAMKQLLVSLDSDASTADVITLHYIGDGPAQTISGQPFAQVMMQGMMIASSPPAAGPVTPIPDDAGKPVPEKPTE